MRIGQSSDIHQLVAGRKLILGGVEIPSEKGLLGHSDADALCHAVGEAILGALALGDLGSHFPDTDPKWEGVSSLVILAGCYQMMDEAGYRIGNVDSLIMIEHPKMAPHIEDMRANFARVLHCDLSQISVKATRGEGMGFVGRGEGVLAQAAVLLEENNHV
ncbi:MAG: 2-C-methyl-D-erythritol 2,4-cyclodiphosphate synthase [Solobacterium sp.]|jgi:2-C-methyl-D-erythritol 2,4-cyclodiphosphate synthase|nr:2-C-methyl-D-erythritol 2,4-cyclodiphosphate synthase [Solobacterium sp.]MCH4282060.1 2-C-methyl-D-erythritol 2,4-cyclodiphosphate synthase [Solobacterium sp.]